MLRFTIISTIFICSCGYLIHNVQGQIITDSKRKLKTQKVDNTNTSSPFSGKKKSRSGQNAAQAGKPTSPRYSSGSPFGGKDRGTVPRYSMADRSKLFRNKPVTPRYSTSGPSGIFKSSPVSPRYSPASPFRSENYAKSRPRYSPGSPFSGKKYDQVARYSPGSPFKGNKYQVSPRYSPGSPFSAKQMKISPRYSPPNPFSGKRYDAHPRYSPDNPFRGNKYNAVTRYSPGSPFKGNKYQVSPRYSPGSPFSAKQMNVTPRYSPGSPFDGNKYNVSPRYSSITPYSTGKIKKDVRYSQGMPFGNRQMKINPRYSPGSPFSGKDYDKVVRYSPGSPFKGKDYKVDVKYSVMNNNFKAYEKRRMHNSFSNDPWGQFEGRMKTDRRWVVNFNHFSGSYATHRYQGPINMPIENKEQYKSSAQSTAQYQGFGKVKFSKSKDMHPGANYHNAMNVSNETIRDGMRKWNIFWVRINRNKEMPDGVKEKVPTPKFDKKETEIWNE